MTLRRRLTLGLLLLLAVFVTGAVVTVVVLRGHLYDQIDAQLDSTPLPAPPPEDRPEAPPIPAADEDREEPVSGLYIAQVAADQTVSVRISGQRLIDTPDLAGLLADPPQGEELRTVDGVLGESSFRVRYVPANRDQQPMIIALPLDDVSATLRQLIYTSVGIAVLLAAVSAILSSWVGRFGLKPISEMTATADAIAAGDTTTRADSYGDATEAGRLASAFNLMLDERDQADTMLRSFVSNASHELRTPLTSIGGYLDLYEQGAFREPGQLDDVVRRMRNESERMNLLVEDLLLLARFDEEQPLEIAPVDVPLLLNDAAASAQAAHPDRSIAVAESSVGDLHVQADRLRIQQAVASLVHNAVAHTDAAVVLDAQTTDEDVKISVTDDGPGLAAQDAALVFDRFYRTDASRSRRAGGSGLGLSIVKSIAEAHGGTVSVITDVGQGARFTISLPRQHGTGDEQPELVQPVPKLSRRHAPGQLEA